MNIVERWPGPTSRKPRDAGHPELETELYWAGDVGHPPTCSQHEEHSDNTSNENNSQSKSRAEQVKENGERGRASEERVLKDKGLEKNNEKVSGKEGNSIPDYLTEDKVGDIKDAQKVTNTKQIRIQKESAAQTGKQHEITTGTHTDVSENAAKGSNVVRRDDLGPKEPKKY